jgi:hypothetical protein
MNAFTTGVEEGMIKTAVTQGWVAKKLTGVKIPGNAAAHALLGQRIGKARDRLRRHHGQLKTLNDYKNVSNKMGPRELKARSAKIEGLKKKLPVYQAHHEGLQKLIPNF